MDDLVLLAKNISYIAHSGQYRRSGEPYFMHPFRVSQKCTSDKCKIIALLHDVLEDSEETIKTLFKKGIPRELILVVEVLTKSKNESYNEYLRKIKLNKLATEVKCFDLLDNLCDNPSRKQILKYSKALYYLTV